MEGNVSFTYIIKNELSNNEVEFEEARSIISAFAKINGQMQIQNKQTKIVLSSESADTAKYIYKLIRKYYPQYNLSTSFVKVMKLYKATEYRINVLGDVDSFLEDIKLDLWDSKINYDLKNKPDRIRGYLIGTFLASGSCTTPESTNYHLELSVNDEKYAHEIIKLINKIKNLEFGFKITQRRTKYVIYLKKSANISDFLAYLNALNSCMEFEDIRINRDYSNSTNRLINCDTYNFNKSLETSRKQLEMIDFLDKRIGLDNLSNEKLRELCKLRRDNPETNYSELATLLAERMHKSVSKSNINHLFIKLKETYENLNHDD